LQIKEFSSIHQFPQAKWNDLVDRFGTSVYQRWEWLAAYEQGYPLKALKSVHHLVGYSGSGQLIALLPLFCVKNDPYWLSVAADLKNAPQEFFAMPYLISPSWYGFYSDIVGDKQTADYASFVEQAAERIEQICQSLKLPYCCFNAILKTNRSGQLLQEVGYRPYTIMDNTTLSLKGSRFADYINGLTSNNMRNNIRRYARRLAAADIEQQIISAPTSEQIDKFYNLLVQTFARHGNPKLADPVYTLQAIFSAFGKNAQLVVLHKEEQWIAAAICLVDGDVFYACFPGMLMNEELRPLNLRLNLYCGCIKRALELGCRKVEFGRTGYEFKAKLGIDRLPTPTLVKAYAKEADFIYDSFSKLGARL